MLQLWSWGFLVLYIGGMVAFGALGRRRVHSADDFAIARTSYGPLWLAFAFTATTASGATFLGLPGIAYEAGLSGIWFGILYPLGVYIGVLICLKVVGRAGMDFGSRSIPEYLGDRYQSELVRIAVSVFSLMLLFYLAGQLVSGLVMFERMLGLDTFWALAITTLVLLVYMGLGGAHADILTDGAQGAVMLGIAILIGVLFFTGYGVDGGFSGMLSRIERLDPESVGVLNRGYYLSDSWWDLFAIFVAHLPLGLLPHIGSKLWSLKSGASRRRFIVLSFVFGLVLPVIGMGGILARAVLGDELFGGELTTNEAIPALFIQLFPTWVAALLGVGILAAVMSTADGLVLSSSQIFANDLYRRTFARRWQSGLSDAEIDRRALVISRWATFGVLLASALMAWGLQNMNVALLVWVGVGGMMAALAGPLVLGALWTGVTRTGAIWGFFAGAAVFIVTHAGLIDPSGFQGTPLFGPLEWLRGEAPSPYSCAAMGEIVSVAVTVVVSRLTRPLPETHVRRVFGAERAA